MHKVTSCVHFPYEPIFACCAQVRVEARRKGGSNVFLVICSDIMDILLLFHSVVLEKNVIFNRQVLLRSSF